MRGTWRTMAASVVAVALTPMFGPMELIAGQVTGVAEASETEKAALQPYLGCIERLWP